jgi:ABC-type sulfate/molybdate transport systems ATPase subunit
MVELKKSSRSTKIAFSVGNLDYILPEKKILSSINIEIPEGKIGVVIGQSGAGKSTFIKLLAGLLAPTSGAILYKAKSLDGPTRLIPGNPEITRIAQDFELMPHITAIENVYQGAMHLLDEEKLALGMELLTLFGLENVAHQQTKTLSGGEQQRVAIAKAMASKKDVLLFDEAFSQLDLGTKASALVRLKRYLNKKNRTALFVVHDPQDAFYLADFVLVLEEGKLVQSGDLFDVFNKSSSSKIASLFGLVNKMSVKRAKELFPNKWQNFNRNRQKIWFRPNMAKITDLALGYETLDSFFNGKSNLQLVKIGRTEIWFEVD